MTSPAKRSVARYGWRPDLPDHRDHKYAVVHDTVSLPPSADLRPGCPPVYDQGDLGSCTANAIGAAFQYDQMKEKLPHAWVPSRLFIYWNERDIEGTVGEDAGAMIRDGIKVVASLGVCSEETWTYNPARLTTRPSKSAYTAAKSHLATSYQRLDNTRINQLKGVLASGLPFIFGFTCYDSFEGEDVARTGVLNLPGPHEAQVGGHAVLCVGYDDRTQRFLIRNSWGPGWGQAGYFTIPYAYLTNPDLADDFWVLKTVVGK